MPYQDTVFGGLMKAFPRWRFDKLVERHRGGLSGPAALVVEPAPGHGVRPAVWLALRCARRSVRWNAFRAAMPISGWNRCAALRWRMPTGCVRRPCSRNVLEALVGELGRRGGRRGKEMLRLIDATRVDGRQADRELGGRRCRQAARGLRPRRGRASLLCRDLGQDERHHAGQALPHRARRNLRLRQGLLRLRLLGCARCQGLPASSPA